MKSPQRTQQPDVTVAAKSDKRRIADPYEEEFDSPIEAMTRAQAEAAMTFALTLPAIRFQQGGRRLFATSLPLGTAVRRIKTDPVSKGDDPEQKRNRPIMPDQVAAIAKYIKDQVERKDKYILPSLTLNVSQRLRSFSVRTSSTIRSCYLAVPETVELYVTDGQHRLKGIEAVLRDHPELERDSIGLTIVEEEDLSQIHQDFADCALTKPVPPALLTVFNQRDPLSQMTKRVAAEVAFFRGRIDKTGTRIGKHSFHVFTMNQVRMGVADFITGSSLQGKAQLERSIDSFIGQENEFAAKLEWLKEFYDKFTQHNSEWLKVANRNAGALAEEIDTYKLREEYVHFTATGLVILSRVGHSIYKRTANKRDALIRKLAELDWSRRGELWRGNVVAEGGSVVTQRAQVTEAVTRVRSLLELEFAESGKAGLNEKQLG